MKKEIILVSLLSIGVSPSAFAYPIVDIYDFRQITTSGDWRSTIGKFDCRSGDVKITNYEFSKSQYQKHYNLMFDTWYSKEGVREVGRSPGSYGANKRRQDLEQGEDNYGWFVALTKEKCDPKSSGVIAFNASGKVEIIRKNQDQLDYSSKVRFMYNCGTHRSTGPEVNRWMTTNQNVDYMMKRYQLGRGAAWEGILRSRAKGLGACIFR